MLYRALRRLDYRGRFVPPGEVLDLTHMSEQNRRALIDHEAISPVYAPPVGAFELLREDSTKLGEGGAHDLADIIIMGAVGLEKIVGPRAQAYVEFARQQLEVRDAYCVHR